MKLLTKAQRKQLIKNYEENLRSGDSYDFRPVVKFFNPCGAATWLITELDPETNIMYGLCDLGMGFPELGYVSLDELASTRVQFGLSIERELHFKADKTLSKYAEEAFKEGRIAA